MSVSINFRVDMRPYSGYNDPAFPISGWIAQGGAVGDASGGNLIMDFNFMAGEEIPRISELFNLEQISIDTASAVSEVILMETRNMDVLSPARAASPQKWAWITNAVLGNSAIRSDFVPKGPLPIWLGVPNQDAPSQEGGIRFTWTNVDLRLYAITLQGYRWGPRSVLAPGGPQRPPFGYFGP